MRGFFNTDLSPWRKTHIFLEIDYIQKAIAQQVAVGNNISDDPKMYATGKFYFSQKS